MTAQLCLGIVVVAAFLAILWFFAAGFRMTWLSGYKFYLVSHLIYAVPQLALLLLLFFAYELPRWLPSVFTTGLWRWFLIVPILGSIVGQIFKWTREDSARKADPTRWNAWASMAREARQRSWVDRILVQRVDVVLPKQQ